MTAVYVIVREAGQQDVFLLPHKAVGAWVSEVGLRNLAQRKGARVVVLRVVDGVITLEEG